MRFRGPDTVPTIAIMLLLSCATVAESTAEVYRLDGEGRPEPAEIVFADGVLDPLFGFLLGVLDADLFGDVDSSDLDSIMSLGGGSRMPVDVVAKMTRAPGKGSRTSPRSIVRIEFHEPVDVPIPYSILGYNPGSLRATREMELLHWVVGDESFEFEDEDEKNRRVDVREGHLFMFAQGSMEMDIDGWLDRLMRGRLDDVELSGFFVFRDGDKRVGLGFGYSKKKKGRTGAFDFGANESIFPASKAYLSLGRTLRERGERLLSGPTASAPGTISRESTNR